MCGVCGWGDETSNITKYGALGRYAAARHYAGTIFFSRRGSDPIQSAVRLSTEARAGPSLVGRK